MQLLYFFLLLLQLFSVADFVRPNRGRKQMKTKRFNRMAVLVLPKFEELNKKLPTPAALPTTKLATKKSKAKRNQSESQEPPVKIEVIHIYHYPTQDNMMTTTTRVGVIEPGKKNSAGRKTHVKLSGKPQSFKQPFRGKVLSGKKDGRLLPQSANSILSSEVEKQEEGEEVEEEEEEPLVMKKEAVRRPVPSFYLNGKPCSKAEISYCWDDGSCAWWQICKTFNCITDCYIRFGDEWRWR